MSKRKKQTNNRKCFQPHFRKFHDKKTTSHPQYVYGEQGRDYKVLGLTSSDTTNGVSNIALERNPEPNNKEKSYIRPQPDKVNKGVRNERLKGWKFTKNDKIKVRKIIDTHDKKK